MVIARCCNPLPPFGNHAVSCRFYALLLSSILHLEKKTSRLSNEKLLNYSVRIMPIGIVEVHQKNMIITKNIRPFLVFVNEKVLKSQISIFFDSWRHMLRDFDFDYSYCIVLPLCVSMNMATIPHLSSPTVSQLTVRLLLDQSSLTFVGHFTNVFQLFSLSTTDYKFFLPEVCL